MKKTLLFVAGLLLACATGSFAAIYTVNNNTNFSANYSSLQAAIDAVPAGSVLLVQGSGLSYGNVVLNKQLVIIGPGYNLAQNPAPHTQADALIGGCNTFNIRAGASGSIISGMYFGGRVDFDTTNNILFQSNYCQNGIDLDRSSNLTIAKNYVRNGGTNLIYALNSTAIFVRNNTIELTTQGQAVAYQYNIGGALAPNLANMTVDNNTVIGNYNHTSTSPYSIFLCYGASGTYLADMQVRSNIIVLKGTQSITRVFTSGANTYSTLQLSNNAVSDSSYSTSVNVLNMASPAAMFTNWTGTSYALDYNTRTAAGSPAIGAGLGGVTCGAYGGADPYAVSGLSMVPNISYLSMPTIGTTGYGIDVHIKAKANK